MLKPMVVQYLVGLCCMRHDLAASEITIGDMVYDEAAEKDRDVDVTVVIPAADGSRLAFKAVEVKHESKPLDVGKVEQLCLKLSDMSEITHRSIVSTSGYTDGARRKARSHNVDLYSLLKWTQPIGEEFPDFAGTGTPEEFLAHVQSSLLYWVNANVFLHALGGVSSFNYENDTSALGADGKVHSLFSTMGQFVDAVLLRSTNILIHQEPAITIGKAFPYGMAAKDADYLAGPAWPHTHTLDLADDGVYLRVSDHEPFQIKSATISGQLQWRKRKRDPQFLIMKNVEDGALFAGAAIADFGGESEQMFAMVFPKTGREIGISQFTLPEKQANLIHELKIKVPS